LLGFFHISEKLKKLNELIGTDIWPAHPQWCAIIHCRTIWRVTMRKDISLSATVDPDAARILTELAEREAEGNKSQMLRRILREAAAARGLRMLADPVRQCVARPRPAA